MDFISQLSDVKLSQLLILKLVDEILGVLVVNMVLQVLDVPLVILNSLSQDLYVVRESLGLSAAASLQHFGFLRLDLDLLLKGP